MKRRVADLDRYMHTTADSWRWRPAGGPDTEAIVALAQQHFGLETAGIFRNDPIEYSRNVMLAIVTQFYNPKMELLSVAVDNETQRIVAYTWAMRDQRSPWSTEEMVAIRVAHCDMSLSARDRIFLCAQMIRMWEKWAEACKIEIICSSTIRQDQPGFLHLHQAAGYIVRGSIAYKRLSVATFVVDDSGPVMVNTRIDSRTATYNQDEYNSHSTDHTISSKEFRAAG